MDSACSDKSAIASRVLQLHTPSMRPCTRLQNANFSSTILESKSGTENHELTASDFALKSSQSPNSSSTILESFGCLLTFLAFPKADSNPKILESKSGTEITNPTSSDFNLESTFDKSTISLSSQAYSPFLSSRALRHANPLLSSRDFRKEVVAIHKSAKADSSKDYSASAEKMDCRAIATALARNDRVGRVDCRADFQSARNDRENNATSKKVDSRQTTQKSSRKQLTLESTFTPQIQLECEKLAQLLESSLYKNAFSCHIEPQAKYLLSSRALRQQGVAIHKSAKVDSSKNAAILNEQPKDSRFCDEKPLLCKPRKEIRLAVYRHSAAQQSKVYRAKPNPPAKFN